MERQRFTTRLDTPICPWCQCPSLRTSLWGYMICTAHLLVLPSTVKLISGSLAASGTGFPSDSCRAPWWIQGGCVPAHCFPVKAEQQNHKKNLFNLPACEAGPRASSVASGCAGNWSNPGKEDFRPFQPKHIHSLNLQGVWQTGDLHSHPGLV